MPCIKAISTNFVTFERFLEVFHAKQNSKTLKVPMRFEFFYYLMQKSFQNDKEWHLFYCDSTLGCGVIEDFDLCKLEDL